MKGHDILGLAQTGTGKILVATDVAARGIGIPGVACVVNDDLPDVPDSCVHRIGRTARAGREGQAVALCAPEEAGLPAEIQTLMKAAIPVASGTAAAPARGLNHLPFQGLCRSLGTRLPALKPEGCGAGRPASCRDTAARPDRPRSGPRWPR
jgi:ATP-dependent RNA helicase RhlE